MLSKWDGPGWQAAMAVPDMGMDMENDIPHISVLNRKK